MRVSWNSASLFGCLALGLSCLAIPKAAHAQTDIPVTNGSFEQPDPNSTVKPLGWFRRNFGATQPTPNTADPTWEYVTNATDAFDGTDYVCLHAPPAGFGNPVSWELEGLTPGAVNTDNAGQGSLLPVTPGGLYEVSVYARFTGTATGQVRMRVQNQATNDPSAATVTTGGLYDVSRPTNGWVKLTSGPFIARSNFISPRLYGNLLTGDVVACFDKVEFKELALPVTVTGIVRNANGDPYPGVGVGINIPTKNGLADPIGSATTGDDGRFSITFPKIGDTFVAQAWIENNTPSDNVPVNLTGDTTITLNPTPLANILAGKPVVAVSSAEDGTPPPATFTNDGNTGTRWSTRGGVTGDDPELPHYVVYDMGESVNFADIRSAEVWWETARTGHWQIRVSDTPPDPAMYTPQNGGNNALALQYGTVVYDSQPGAADFSLQRGTEGVYRDIVTQFTPGSGRYVMIALVQAGPFPNHSIYEFKLLVPAVTVTGQLVDQNGAPVQGTVMTYPGGNNQLATDDQGNFSLLVPQNASSVSYMAHSLQGATVYTLSNPFTVSPQTPAIGQVRMNAAPNEIAAGAATDIYAQADPTIDINDTGMDKAQGVDQNFTTRMSTVHIDSIDTVVTPATPIYYIIDMGAPKQINTISIDWETARPSQYRVQVASTYNFAGRTGGNWEDVAVSTTPPDTRIAYNWGGGDFIEIITFPARSAQYIRIVVESVLAPFDNFSIWEVQAANLTQLPVPLGRTRQALSIWGGLQAAPADITSLNVDNTGTSANVVDLFDVVALAKQSL